MRSYTGNLSAGFVCIFLSAVFVHTYPSPLAAAEQITTDQDDEDQDPTPEEIKRYVDRNRVAALELRDLYEGINRFRYDDKFQLYGFSENGPYRWWNEKMKNYRNKWFGSDVKFEDRIDADIADAWSKLNVQSFNYYGTAGKGDKYDAEDEAYIQRVLRKFAD